MDPNRMTQKSQEALQRAQQLAVQFGHVEVDGEHLLMALLTQEGGVIPRLLTKADVSLEALVANLRNRDCASLDVTIEALAHIGNDVAVLPLIALFHDVEDEGVREHIARALAAMEEVESIEEVLNLLHGRRPIDQLGLR